MHKAYKEMKNKDKKSKFKGERGGKSILTTLERKLR